MKNQSKASKSTPRVRKQRMTLGQLIAATYTAVGEKGAPRLLKLALESELVRFAPRPVF
jgi:hypothetical protein